MIIINTFYGNINKKPLWKMFSKQKKLVGRMALFSIFANLFNVWLNERQVGSHIFCPPSGAVHCLAGIKKIQPCGILPTIALSVQRST